MKVQSDGRWIRVGKTIKKIYAIDQTYLIFKKENNLRKQIKSLIMLECKNYIFALKEMHKSCLNSTLI